MNISISVRELKVNELIRILDVIDAESSFSIENNGREFTFAELIKAQEVIK